MITQYTYDTLGDVLQTIQDYNPNEPAASETNGMMTPLATR